jgi:hypothetical protein
MNVSAVVAGSLGPQGLVSEGGMKANVPFTTLLLVLLLACLTGCGEERGSLNEYPVALAEGTYRVAFGRGYQAADEDRLLAVTARLDRATNQVVFTLANGSQQTLAFSPRPRSQWQPDCRTMSSRALDEVADLSPAPLQLESLTFVTPIAYAKCTPSRMILANDIDELSPFLALDLE